MDTEYDTDTWIPVKYIKLNSDTNVNVGVVSDTRHSKRLECPCFITYFTMLGGRIAFVFRIIRRIPMYAIALINSVLDNP